MRASPLPREVLVRGRNYLLKDPSVERGCLITTDWDIVPFKNVAEPAVSRIRMGPEDFGKFADLMMFGSVWGWLHSHPHWPPFPSSIDIQYQPAPITMVIYSVPMDAFGVYSPEEINALNELYTNGARTETTLIDEVERWQERKGKEFIRL
jgi:proteasome lid subunit RPN8/RPN11